ncbi:MAG: polysaccharide biosynthesis/export family protein [Dysgonomonas sp.]|jgi:polysaccharide export outer membrane protein|nr:polysaccharide biosynthesis/export family protein [Prevotella sp.]MDR3059507.1 polysaccharide biosynthesis/export family protein [Prevotella sp.]
MKSALYYLLTIVFVVGIFSSCISSEEVNYLQTINLQYPLEPYKEYRLAVDDKISCSISTSDEEMVTTFNTVVGVNQSTVKAYTIYSDSTVILPFFGKVKVAGHTVQEAEEIIQKFMQESIKDVQVKVTLSSNYFYILASNRQGFYSVYKDNMTIYQALAISEQTTGTMDLSKVSIIRKDGQGNSLVKTFDLRTQDVIQSEFYYIKPNDLIYFPTNKNSFFNIESLGSFAATMMIPLTFLVYTVMYGW